MLAGETRLGQAGPGAGTGRDLHSGGESPEYLHRELYCIGLSPISKAYVRGNSFFPVSNKISQVLSAAANAFTTWK